MSTSKELEVEGLADLNEVALPLGLKVTGNFDAFKIHRKKGRGWQVIYESDDLAAQGFDRAYGYLDAYTLGRNAVQSIVTTCEELGMEIGAVMEEKEVWGL